MRHQQLRSLSGQLWELRETACQSMYFIKWLTLCVRPVNITIFRRAATPPTLERLLPSGMAGKPAVMGWPGGLACVRADTGVIPVALEPMPPYDPLSP